MTTPLCLRPAWRSLGCSRWFRRSSLLVSVYGLVADPSQVQEQVSDLLGAAPQEARDLIESQLEAIVEESGSGATIATVIGIVIALWSASAGMKALVAALNAAYDEEEERKFVKLRGLSLLLTLGAILFLVAAFAAVALLPALVAGTELGTPRGS